ncbi:hypothetical protein EDC04DRAFT_2617404 [Pisolithus marmoratus]|nr:hypothetical protein EDC04DRAFT_2617404 [Pisolithus marmoratus]
MNAINAKYASALWKYQLQLNVVANFECQHNITDRWTPLHPDCTVNVQTLKANLAKMGYKMCKHISKVISRHSAAIHTTLKHYNRLAPHQHPPHPRLDYADVISYSLLGEFSLLKHSCYEVLEKPWALPDNCEMMTKLQAWLDYDGEKMKVTAQGFRDLGSLGLASEMESMYTKRACINNFHHAQLQKIYGMPGYMGHRPIGAQLQVVCDGASCEDKEEDGDDDNDDGNAFHLGDTLDRVPLH